MKGELHLPVVFGGARSLDQLHEQLRLSLSLALFTWEEEPQVIELFDGPYGRTEPTTGFFFPGGVRLEKIQAPY